MIYKIKVTPWAKKQKILWVMSNGVIKISIKTPPENWKANKELIKYISEMSGYNQKDIAIISWEKSKEKTIQTPWIIQIFDQLR